MILIGDYMMRKKKQLGASKYKRWAYINKIKRANKWKRIWIEEKKTNKQTNDL